REASLKTLLLVERARDQVVERQRPVPPAQSARHPLGHARTLQWEARERPARGARRGPLARYQRCGGELVKSSSSLMARSTGSPFRTLPLAVPRTSRSL